MKSVTAAAAVLFMVMYMPAMTQPCDGIRGMVKDKVTGEPLPGAHVRSTLNWRVGVSTADDGTFIIQVTAPDTLVVSYVGYQNVSYPISATGDCNVTIELPPAGVEMDGVTITAPPLIAEEFRSTAIRKLDIYLNPAAKADPLLAVSTLPSATTLDESANVSLRGSTASETGVFINNVPVYDAIRYSQLNGIGTFSIFNTAIIDKVQVFPGNPPLEYGNAASGIVALETDTRVPRELSAQLALSLASFGGTLQLPAGKRTALQMFSNYQPSAILKALNKEALEDIRKFNSLDGGIHITHRFNNEALLRFYNYALLESYTFHYRHPTYDGNFNQGKKRSLAILNFHQRIGASEISFNQGWSTSKADYDYSASRIDVGQRDLYSSINYRYYGNKFDLKLGASHDNRSSGFDGTFPMFDYAIGEHHPVVSERGTTALLLNEAYSYLKINPLRWMTIGQGVRSVFPRVDRPWAWSYQTNARIDASPAFYFLLSTGRYHQTVFDESANTETVRSIQHSVDAVFTDKSLELSSSIFYKRINRNEQTKTVTGGELYVKFNRTNKIQAQLSFTTLNAWVQDNGLTYRDVYDIHYFLRANLQYRFNPKWTASSVIQLRQGSVETPVASAHYDPVAQAFKPEFVQRDMAQRLPGYSMVSATASRMTSLGEHVAAVFFCSVNNVLNSENIRTYYYSADYSTRTPVLFSARTVYFGMVLYF